MEVRLFPLRSTGEHDALVQRLREEPCLSETMTGKAPRFQMYGTRERHEDGPPHFHVVVVWNFALLEERARVLLPLLPAASTVCAVRVVLVVPLGGSAIPNTHVVLRSLPAGSRVSVHWCGQEFSVPSLLPAGTRVMVSAAFAEPVLIGDLPALAARVAISVVSRHCPADTLGGVLEDVHILPSWPDGEEVESWNGTLCAGTGDPNGKNERLSQFCRTEGDLSAVLALVYGAYSP